MMKIQLRFFAVLLMGITVQAQVGINTASPNPSALLDLNSSNKGLLLPRVTLLSTSDIVTIPNPALISARGALTAPQAGYYMFSVRLTELMPASAQDLELGPYIRAANLVTYTYRYRGSGNENQIASILGTVYLTQNQVTPDFQWFLGNNTCTSANRIVAQEVIWEYLGNPL